MKKILSLALVLSVFASSFCVRADNFNISAKSAIVVNGATGAVIFSQNENERLPMASTTKIMTALLLCENCDLDETVVTTREMVTVEGSSMGLLEGDTVSFKALLYGMMLPSGNDAATTTAYALAGSLEGFALMMNKKAAEIGMENTNFVTPSGLDADMHYTTAADMAKLSVYAMKNDIFRKAVSTKSISVEYGNPPYRRTLTGHNKMLDLYDGAVGIKTGYTSKSGKCLVSAAERNGKKVIAVTLCDNATWNNHAVLLDLGFSRLTDKSLELPREFSKIEVISGESKYAKLDCDTSVISLTADETEQLSYKIAIKDFIYAPAKKGDKVGTICFYIGENPIRELDITVSDRVDVKKTPNIGFREKYFQYLIKLLSF